MVWEVVLARGQLSACPAACAPPSSRAGEKMGTLGEEPRLRLARCSPAAPSRSCLQMPSSVSLADFPISILLSSLKALGFSRSWLLPYAVEESQDAYCRRIHLYQRELGNSRTGIQPHLCLMTVSSALPLFLLLPLV